MSDFTTTGPVEQAASEVVLMDVVQSYFEFVVETRCGIPSISLFGTAEDWKKLASKTRELGRFLGLDYWLDQVHPVLEQFVSVASGNEPDLDFWQNIYKGEEGRGGIDAVGQLLKLFPFVNRSGRMTVNPVLAGRAVDPAELPQALSNVPFIWLYHGEPLDYQFIAGHDAIGYEEETGALRPLIGWAIRPKP